jgi:hypothetical protein
MEQSVRLSPGWREAGLILLLLAPLCYLLFLHGGPIPQDRGYHVFADVRTCLGLQNFGNVVSNLLAAAAPFFVYLMLRKRGPVATLKDEG